MNKDYLYYKVSRDAVHSEIFLYPLEIVFADTKSMQRLRYLSQLAGAEYVYAGATHNRFSHSLGVMHLSGLYAEKLFPDNQSKYRLLRLCGLLHDIGHGPYSHQFDDMIYKRMGMKEGHDTYRTEIIKNHLKEDCLNALKNIQDPRTKTDFYKDFSMTVEYDVTENNLEKAFDDLIKNILFIYESEKTGHVEFNIIQGPLGADRLDFVLRDSYYAGTRHFGTGAIDRLIRNSLLLENGKLCYSIKVIDDIYSSLFARFMMYKNVYFHKTSRAADLMIQEILKISYDLLNLPDRVKNYTTFLKLTDQRIMNEIEILYENVYEKQSSVLKFNSNLFENSDKIIYAYTLVNRLKNRDLWKLILEIPFYTKGVDPSTISISVAENALKKIKLNIENKIKDKIDKSDKNELFYILDNFDSIFKIDTPYKLSLVHPNEFLSSDVYIKDIDDKIITFDDLYEKYPAYKLLENNLIQIVRIYMKEDKREILKKYNLVVEDKNIEINTRW